MSVPLNLLPFILEAVYRVLFGKKSVIEPHDWH